MNDRNIWKLSVDTGGTFTDCLAVSPEGKESRLKILSSSALRGTVKEQVGKREIEVLVKWYYPGHQLTGYSLYLLPEETGYTVNSVSSDGHTITLASEIRCKPGQTFEIHSDEEVPVFAARLLTGTTRSGSFPAMELRLGTTKGTNALLERKGSPVTFLVTKGFGDILEIGDQRRPDLFDLHVKKPPVLYKNVIEVNERIDAEGSVIEPLVENECQRVLKKLEDNGESGISLAIAFLHGYKNAAHEKLLAEHLKNAGFDFLSHSADLSSNSGFISRAETTVVNSYIGPLISDYLENIQKSTGAQILVMTSAGTLLKANAFAPKDGLLSGPAGGVKGAVSIGQSSGIEQLITLDMGGTSTDIAIYNEKEDYNFETRVGPAIIQAPGLAIETIAAGGGSICYYDHGILQVGPESAGAIPGPACYGGNGPLSLTDINLWAGRVSESNFSIPLNKEKSGKAFDKLYSQIKRDDPDIDKRSLLGSILQIANERMAKSIRQLAIRKGVDPTEFTLITYGGAGGQHACDLAKELGINSILVPYDAGVLSAFGIQDSQQARFSEREIMKSYDEIRESLPEIVSSVTQIAQKSLLQEGFHQNETYIRECKIYLRFSGQETSLELDYHDDINLPEEFKLEYIKMYGHWIEGQILEVMSIKILSAVKSRPMQELILPEKSQTPVEQTMQLMLEGGQMVNGKVYDWESLSKGDKIIGPALLTSANSTLVVQSEWQLTLDNNLNAYLKYSHENTSQKISVTERVGLTLFTHRFMSVVEEMGALLQRTAFSVNIRERVDFSCTMLDSDGYLVVNAPHIPVHLGSMGICVRKILGKLELEEGDVVITNHPAYGGSHLPDITLVSPVYVQDHLIGYVANRAHHAEIGGRVPGSMPPDATELEEEGVVIAPVFLLKKGMPKWDEIRDIFLNARYPTRNIEENMADLRGALASIFNGIQGLKSLCCRYGYKQVVKYMVLLNEYGGQRIRERLRDLPEKDYHAMERLDDGNELSFSMTIGQENTSIDFTGSAPVHHGNLNATPAIVQSVLLYFLRIVLKEDFPLNEGLLKHITINLPHGLLNPDFDAHLPAVAGGNTEVSQRLIDTLLKALGIVACSQGTMNNVIFGNDRFGYYETIGGGTGAGNGFHGCDAVHQHMTNTKITDPEIAELRYPVRLEKFGIRHHSGGSGKWHGGNGIVRRMKFLETVELSIISQHRETAPYGMSGGEAGKTGKQFLFQTGNKIKLSGIDHRICSAGTIFEIHTPGGGGYGYKSDDNESVS